jgi:hypothetical protein
MKWRAKYCICVMRPNTEDTADSTEFAEDFSFVQQTELQGVFYQPDGIAYAKL